MTDVSTTENAVAPLDSVESVAQLMAMVNENVANIADVIGDGYSVLNRDGKDKLVGIPFYILAAKETYDADTQRPYWVMRVITNTDEKFVITDGGTGIPAQLKQLRDSGEARAVFVPRGLRRSDYRNEYGAASTYYLDISGA